VKERWRGSGVKCCHGDKTRPALAGLSQREDKVLLWEFVQKQSGKGEQWLPSLHRITEW